MNKYITIVDVKSYNQLFNIINKRSGVVIGALSHNPLLEESCLLTASETIWNITCLEYVLEFMEKQFKDFKLKYEIAFMKQPKIPNRKTHIFELQLLNQENQENQYQEFKGIIKWFSSWRQYCLFSDQVIYSRDELKQIIEFFKIEKLPCGHPITDKRDSDILNNCIACQIDTVFDTVYEKMRSSA